MVRAWGVDEDIMDYFEVVWWGQYISEILISELNFKTYYLIECLIIIFQRNEGCDGNRVQ